MGFKTRLTLSLGFIFSKSGEIKKENEENNFKF